jgi:hypothetical protein
LVVGGAAATKSGQVEEVQHERRVEIGQLQRRRWLASLPLEEAEPFADHASV